MRKKIKVTNNMVEIQKHLENLYAKIDFQIMLYEASNAQKSKIFFTKRI